MSGAAGKLIGLAEKEGVTVPELIKFLASPAGYTLSKALGFVEDKTGLPQGILSLAANPVSAVTDYAKTQANNLVYDENQPSKIENIIAELRAANPDRPNYVGPQEEYSPLSMANATKFADTIGVQPSDQVASVDQSRFNDELREGLYGTITPNYASFVGPQEYNSPADQIGVQFLAEDLGVKPTTTSSGTQVPTLTPELLQTIMAPPAESVDAVQDTANMFGNSTPESLGLTESAGGLGDYGSYAGDRDIDNSGGGKFMAYANGGFIHRGIR